MQTNGHKKEVVYKGSGYAIVKSGDKLVMRFYAQNLTGFLIDGAIAQVKTTPLKVDFYTITKSVKIIWNSAFEGMDLKNFSFEKATGIEEIYSYAFKDCKNLKWPKHGFAGCYQIADNAFEGAQIIKREETQENSEEQQNIDK
ncbi:MAG: leucine-rich repeat protein [Candidatus Onthoplasma sp.]